jgi:hypothetical protein
MGKGRDKQGREAKKKKKVKLPGGPPGADVQFRHHVAPAPAEQTPKAPE